MTMLQVIFLSYIKVPRCRLNLQVNKFQFAPVNSHIFLLMLMEIPGNMHPLLFKILLNMSQFGFTGHLRPVS